MFLKGKFLKPHQVIDSEYKDVYTYIKYIRIKSLVFMSLHMYGVLVLR